MEKSNNSLDKFQNKRSTYTDEVKATLDERYADYKNGMKMVDAEESKREIQKLLSGK
jgi:thymidylate kinase